MTNRRDFFKSLLGLFIAPKVVEALPLPKETVPTLGYKGKDFFKTGIVYAPYMPLLTTGPLTKYHNLEIKKETNCLKTKRDNYSKIIYYPLV